MRRRVIKIVFSIIIAIILLTITSNAATLDLSVDKGNLKENEEVIVKIETDNKIETTTLYMKYDNTKLEYVDNLTQNTIVKNYPEEGVLRVVYLDMTLQGTNELRFKFKVKEETTQGETAIELTNLSMQFVDDTTVYNESNLVQSNLRTTVNIQKTILSRGIIISLIVVAILLVLLVIVHIIYKKSKKK